MPGGSGGLRTSCAFHTTRFAHETSGCIGLPAFPTPLASKGGRFLQILGRIAPRDREFAFGVGPLEMKIESEVVPAFGRGDCLRRNISTSAVYSLAPFFTA